MITYNMTLNFEKKKKIIAHSFEEEGEKVPIDVSLTVNDMVDNIKIVNFKTL